MGHSTTLQHMHAANIDHIRQLAFHVFMLCGCLEPHNVKYVTHYCELEAFHSTMEH